MEAYFNVVCAPDGRGAFFSSAFLRALSCERFFMLLQRYFAADFDVTVEPKQSDSPTIVPPQAAASAPRPPQPASAAPPAI